MILLLEGALIIPKNLFEFNKTEQVSDYFNKGGVYQVDHTFGHDIRPVLEKNCPVNKAASRFQDGC